MSDWILLSNWLPQLIYPLNVVLCLIGMSSILLLMRRYKQATWASILALITLLTFMSPLSTELYRRHEQTYLPVSLQQSPEADAIVVLGGDVGIPIFPRAASQLNGNRLLHAWRLYRLSKAKFILISGGNTFPQAGIQGESSYSAKILENWGIPKSVILLDSLSRNTYENAVASRRMLVEHGIDKILLVTSAFHMPRATLTFRKVGFDVIPSPSSYNLTSYRKPAVLSWWPSLGNLGKAQSVIREELGMFVYRIRDWI